MTAAPPYEVLEINDVSTGIALRRRAYVVIDPYNAARVEEVCRDAMKRLIAPGVECTDSQGRLHSGRFHADVAFLFIHERSAAGGKGMLLARAQYVRKGTPRQAIPAAWKGQHTTRVLKGDRGTVTLAIERVT
jgi:hypothetical protein